MRNHSREIMPIDFVPTACLQGAEGYPCVTVTLASGLNLALVYKQISQVGLACHQGQLFIVREIL